MLFNGVIIELKEVTASDRRKSRYKETSKLDIRFVFENSRRKLRKGAKSTYGEWCERYDFIYYDRIIPEAWIKEKGKEKYPSFIKFNGYKRKAYGHSR